MLKNENEINAKRVDEELENYKKEIKRLKENISET